MNEENKNLPEQKEKNTPVSGDNQKKEEKSTPETPSSAPEAQKKSDADKGEKKKRPPLSMRTKRRLILVSIISGVILLGLITTLIVVAIFNNRPPEFSTVRDRFVYLIEESQKLNDAVWGQGLPTYRRVTREIKSYVFEFKGEEESIRYFEIQDERYGTVVSYEYQIRRMDGKVNDDGVKIFTIYDAETGGVLTEYKQNASRFAQRSKTPIEGKEVLFQSEKYYYYALPGYENPDIVYDTIVYTGREDQNYDYVRFDAGFKTTSELQDALKAVYSNDYMAPIYESLFTGAMGGMNDPHQAIYTDYVDQDSDITYLMKSNSKTAWRWTTLRKLTFDYDTMQMVERGNNARSVKVTVQYREEGSDEVKTMTVSFAKENEVWYLNSATY